MPSRIRRSYPRILAKILIAVRFMRKLRNYARGATRINGSIEKITTRRANRPLFTVTRVNKSKEKKERGSKRKQESILDREDLAFGAHARARARAFVGTAEWSNVTYNRVTRHR